MGFVILLQNVFFHAPITFKCVHYDRINHHEGFCTFVFIFVFKVRFYWFNGSGHKAVGSIQG